MVATADALCYADRMKITCPDCGFFRELAADRAPLRAVIATCPKCGCRFRFQPEDGFSQVIEHGQATPARPVASRPQEDDPLPPGAIVPGRAGFAQPGASAEADSGRPRAPEKTAPPAGAAARQADEARPEEDDLSAEASSVNRKRRPRPAAEDDVNPWDMAPRPAGYLSAFYQTTLRVMFGAGRFFAHLDPEAPQLRALLYALIITLIMLCSQYLWLSMSREMLEQAMPADAPLMVVIRFALDQPLFYSLISLAIFVFQIYLGSALLFLCFRMTGVKHATFYIIFQVVAYSTAPLLLCIIPVLGQQVGSIWCLACLVNGCRMALRLDWPRTLLGFAPLVLLFIVMLSSLRLPY